MKKKTLEMILQSIPPFSTPKAELEQYSTPANIAADVLFTAHARGDIEGKVVMDLGCGNGIFAIGAFGLGSELSVGVDIDPVALAEARRNAAERGATVEFVRADVARFSARVDTVFQNPPFGAQKRGADRPFLVTAMSIAEKVYSFHLAETEEFVHNLVSELGGRVALQKRYKFEIPHMFAFHTREKKEFEVVLLCIQRLGELQ